MVCLCRHLPLTSCWQLSKIKFINSSNRKFKVDLPSNKWLSGKLEPYIRQNLNLKSSDIHNKVVKK